MRYCIQQSFKILNYVPPVIKPVMVILKPIHDITAEEILLMTSLAFDVTVEQLKSKLRSREVSDARHAACTLIMKFMPKMRLKQIGALLGNRDHTTIIYARAKVEDMLFSNSPFKTIYNEIISEINSLIYGN